MRRTLRLSPQNSDARVSCGLRNDGRPASSPIRTPVFPSHVMLPHRDGSISPLLAPGRPLSPPQMSLRMSGSEPTLVRITAGAQRARTPAATSPGAAPGRALAITRAFSSGPAKDEAVPRMAYLPRDLRHADRGPQPFSPVISSVLRCGPPQTLLLESFSHAERPRRQPSPEDMPRIRIPEPSPVRRMLPASVPGSLNVPPARVMPPAHSGVLGNGVEVSGSMTLPPARVTPPGHAAVRGNSVEAYAMSPAPSEGAARAPLPRPGWVSPAGPLVQETRSREDSHGDARHREQVRAASPLMPRGSPAATLPRRSWGSPVAPLLPALRRAAPRGGSLGGQTGG